MNNNQYKPKDKKQREQFAEINNPCIQETSYTQNCEYYQKKNRSAFFLIHFRITYIITNLSEQIKYVSSQSNYHS